MGYHTSNAAFAYDMQPQPADLDHAGSAVPAPARPRPARRPRLDVVAGAGLEADQAVSPAFLHVIKVALAVIAVFCLVGGARVALASATSGVLNADAQLSSTLEESRSKSSDLEVMRSVYGSGTRIRDLAEGTLGMVEGTEGVTIDLSEGSASASGAASAGAAASDAASTSSAAASSAAPSAQSAE